jgi:hypothetical protein
MRKVILVAALAALSASFAWGALGDVWASFPAPANYPIALAVPNNYTHYLWVYCNAPPYRIYRLDGNTGSVYDSFVSPQGNGTRGLTFSRNGVGLPTGSYLWMGNRNNYYIYRCRYTDGSVYASFPAYSPDINGLAVKATADGGNSPTCMLSSNWGIPRIYHKNLITGSIQSLFTPSQRPYDIAWDWRNEIIWTGCYGNTVYGFSTTGSLVTSFTVPADNPLGFAYTSNFLWVSTTTGSHRIWKIHCPPFMDNNANVVPASIGKIKATYR